MADKASRCGDNHIGTHLEAFQFLIVAVAVVAAVHSYAAHAVEIVAEALHSLINLLCEFACWTHDYAVDGIVQIAAIVEFREYREQISCCLSSSSLCYAKKVAAFEYWRYTFLLNRCALVKAHVI